MPRPKKVKPARARLQDMPEREARPPWNPLGRDFLRARDLRFSRSLSHPLVPCGVSEVR